MLEFNYSDILQLFSTKPRAYWDAVNDRKPLNNSTALTLILGMKKPDSVKGAGFSCKVARRGFEPLLPG